MKTYLVEMNGNPGRMYDYYAEFNAKSGYITVQANTAAEAAKKLIPEFEALRDYPKTQAPNFPKPREFQSFKIKRSHIKMADTWFVVATIGDEEYLLAKISDVIREDRGDRNVAIINALSMGLQRAFRENHDIYID